ncbi:MAG: hypothetical protein ABIM88_08990, partial [candidate division WOR-3 bacterium]
MMGVLVITGAWAKVFGGPGDDFAYSVAIGATDGNPVIAGYTTSYGNNGEALLMRLSLNTGDFMGAITYGEASYLQEARSIIATPDGGFVITGKWERFLWLFRVNYTGGIIWSRGIASLAGGAGGYAVARTSGYFLSVGYLADDIFAFLWNGSSGDAGYYTNQAEDGEQGPLEIKALAAATAPDSGVIVAGWRYQDYYYHNTNAYVFKTN